MKSTLDFKRSGLVLLAAAGLLISSAHVAAANDVDAVNSQQNLSKRPYQPAQDVPAHEPKAEWEGATLIDQEDRKAKSPNQLQQRRINSLGKQPYMDTVD